MTSKSLQGVKLFIYNIRKESPARGIMKLILDIIEVQKLEGKKYI